MSSLASSEPAEHASALPANPVPYRRSFTLPSRVTVRPAVRSASTDSAEGIETLFICNHAKIVSFTCAGSSARPSSARSAGPLHDGSDSIAWRTPTERTLAVGGLRIYRVITSNVSFLNSGALLHTIFPRSQCWCVDNQSVFVLRIRQDSYYRMELPYETDEDKETIVQFKVVLSQVLQYEKTQCPFARGFEVDQIDRPKTPPRPRSKQQYVPQQRAKKWLFEKSWVPENGPRPSTPVRAASDCGTTSSYDDDDRSSIHTDCSEALLESSETVWDLAPKPPPRRLSIAERASVFQDSRSTSVPVRAGRTMSVTSLGRIPESPKVDSPHKPAKPALDRHVSEAASLVSSTGSFYSLDASTRSSLSPPFMDAQSDIFRPWAATPPKQEQIPRGRTIHRRQLSDATVRTTSTDDIDTPVTPRAPKYPTSMSTVNVHPSSAPSTPPLVEDSDSDSVELPLLDIPTPPNAIRMKRLTGASQRRAFSPMPDVQNLFRAPKRHPGREFTNALMRKTCELVLGPPAHLVSLMLRIARSISNGFGFSTYRVTATEQAPCSWESDDEPEWREEDDFGIPLSHIGRTPKRRRTFSGEVD